MEGWGNKAMGSRARATTAEDQLAVHLMHQQHLVGAMVNTAPSLP